MVYKDVESSSVSIFHDLNYMGTKAAEISSWELRAPVFSRKYVNIPHQAKSNKLKKNGKMMAGI
jgi:hypothetical protein